MKNIYLLVLRILISIVPVWSFAQIGEKPLFNNSWYGFATGHYPKGQSPSMVKAGDLDNDGDSDLVVAQQNFFNGFTVLFNQANGIYSAPIKYNSAAASKGIVIADFNNDQWRDVALSNTGQYGDGNLVSVFFNTGNGRFGAPFNYTVGKGPLGIVAADLDNDGDQDIAVSNSGFGSKTVSVLTNTGGGTFSAPVNFPCGDNPYRLTAAKINNDELVDLVIGNNTQNVTILFNLGNNNFSRRVTLNVIATTPIEDANATVKTADFDNDGDNDIIFSSGLTYHTLNEIALFINNGNGVFGAPRFIALNAFSGSAADLDVGDFNNDAKTDILTCYYSGRTGDGYQVLLNLGNNEFSVPDIKPGGQSTQFITAADVDNDGKLDVVTSDFYSLQVTVHKNTGNAVFPLPPFYTTNNSSAGALDAADIDGDGDLDVVTSASGIAAVGVTVTVLKNNGNGSFTAGIAYSIRAGGVHAKFRELNGDGKPDLIFATAVSSPPYDFHTAINNGDGTFGPRQTWSMNACGWSDIEAIDADNDGDNDAVITEWLGCINVPNSGRRLFISRNNGNGSFSSPIIRLINPSPSCIATGDFNKDGRTDLVTGQSLSMDVHLNSGNNDIFRNPVSYPATESPYDIIVTDLNRDGNPDIAACTEYNHEGMSVWLGNGDGSFQPAQNYNGAYSPDLRNESGITAGDVDADGDVDILVGNYASNDVSLYFNKGNGSFVFRGRVGIYYGVASPLYADFSGDGKKDIAAIVGVPPSGIQSSLAVITGNVFNDAVAVALSQNSEGLKERKSTAAVSILNNPFISYLDIRFNKVPHARVKLTLNDITGKTIAASENYIVHNTYRFQLANTNISSGIYFLVAEIDGRKYKISVLRQ